MRVPLSKYSPNVLTSNVLFVEFCLPNGTQRWDGLSFHAHFQFVQFTFISIWLSLEVFSENFPHTLAEKSNIKLLPKQRKVTPTVNPPTSAAEIAKT